ncbi:MAG: tetratricopeptide repeat protein [Candidatus Microthrix subdominans]
MIDDTAGSAAEQLSALRALVADGRGELAVIRLRRLLQGEPRSIEAQALLASTLLSLHQPEEALRSADAVVAAEPNNPEGHHLRARVLLQLGQASPALAASEAAVDREPLVPAYHKALVRAALSCGDLDAAQSSSAALGRLAPEEPEGRLGEAEVARRRGHLKRADALIGHLEVSHPDHSGVRRLRRAIDEAKAAAPPRRGFFARLADRFRRR